MRFVRGKRGMAAAGEDSIIQKLQSAAADGMRGGDGLSAERVQTVMRFTVTNTYVIFFVISWWNVSARPRGSFCTYL